MSSTRARSSGDRPASLPSRRCSSDRRMASKRWRSATTVGTAPRDRCHVANFSSSSATIVSACAISRRAAREVLLHDRLQIVHVVEEHLLDLADRRLDVARHGEVDDEERIGTVSAGGGFDLRAREDRPLRSGRGHDDVGRAEERRDVLPGRGASTDRSRECFGMRRCAAGDDDLADALRAQVFGGQRADLAGADRPARAGPRVVRRSSAPAPPRQS